MSGPDDDRDDDYECPYEDCPICGSLMQWEPCWKCHGEGGWHDCGEDCCPCLDKEEITEACDECEGRGGYLQCMALPHSEEQLSRHRNAARKPSARAPLPGQLDLFDAPEAPR